MFPLNTPPGVAKISCDLFANGLRIVRDSGISIRLESTGALLLILLKVQGQVHGLDARLWYMLVDLMPVCLFNFFSKILSLSMSDDAIIVTQKILNLYTLIKQ